MFFFFLLRWWWIPLLRSWVPCLGMPHSRRLACSIVGMILASCVSLRVIPTRIVGTRHLHPPGCLRACGTRTGHSQLNRIRPLTPSMLLDIDASFGIIGLGALSAFRLFTTTITPKRVRVVTDIDDTVKSSGNRRFFGIPLGGIDAQCKCFTWGQPPAFFLSQSRLTFPRRLFSCERIVSWNWCVS